MKYLNRYNESKPNEENLFKYFKNVLSKYENFKEIVFEKFLVTNINNKYDSFQYAAEFNTLYKPGLEIEIEDLYKVSILGLEIKKELNLKEVRFEQHTHSSYFILITKDISEYKEMIEGNKMGLI